MIALLIFPLLQVVAADTTLYGCPTCPDLRTESYPLVNNAGKPNYLTFTVNTSMYQSVDNVCYTLQPIPDSPQAYLVTTTATNSDGSFVRDFSINSGISIGLFKASSASYLQLEYNLGSTKCGTQVGYVCSECSQELNRYGYGVSHIYGKIPYSCLSQAEGILAEQNLDEGDVYVFPMTLKPNCYFPPSPNPYYIFNPYCYYLGINCRPSY